MSVLLYYESRLHVVKKFHLYNTQKPKELKNLWFLIWFTYLIWQGMLKNSACDMQCKYAGISKDAKFRPESPHKTVNIQRSTDHHTLKPQQYKQIHLKRSQVWLSRIQLLGSSLKDLNDGHSLILVGSLFQVHDALNWHFEQMLCIWTAPHKPL